MKKKDVIQILLLAVYASMLIFFAYECFQDSSKAGRQAGFVAEIVSKIQEIITGNKPVVDDNYLTLISKLIGHYGYFCILGLVSIFYHLSLDGYNRITRILLHFVIGVLFAFGSEFVAEAVTEGRHASIVDVGIDTLGLMTLSSIVILIYLIRIKVKNKITDKRLV